MSELKYNVGDLVRIKSLDWYNENKDEDGNIDINCDFTFYADRSRYCGKIFTIIEVFDNSYGVKEDNNEYCWTDEMIEGLVEDETKFGTASNPIEPKSNANCLTQERVNETKSCTNINDMNNDAIIVPTSALVEMVKELGVSCPEGYEFQDENGNVINATKIVLEKKKPKYPETYEECCWILEDVADCSLSCFACGLLNNLQRLLLCRNAYWEIAGEEMGLGKPWEPDYSGTFEDGSPIKYVIYSIGTHILKGRKSCPNHILAFPTEEMRDAFYEAFKEDIEYCKELL